jgi:ABC-type lipoprotein release transport system permease subunit
MYWLMGWRNIWRNRRRSAITIGAMAFSVTLLVFFFGFMASWMDQMEENVIGMSVGDIQIHHPQYLADQNLYQLVPDAEALLQKLHGDGYAAAPRVYGYGLMASDVSGKSAGAQFKGIALDYEPKVTILDRDRNILEGGYLTGETRLELPESQAPEEPFEDPLAMFEDPLGEDVGYEAGPEPLVVGQVVLGKKLAHTLSVGPGDTVNVVTMSADGTMGNELFDVVGVFKNFSELEDRSLALLTRTDYQRLFRLPDDQVHEIAIRRPEGADLQESRATVAKLAGNRGEARTWQEILPAIAEMITLQRSMMVLFGFMMYIGAGLLIMNSTLMMVFERIREFGVMKAIGLRPLQILLLVFFETFWMSVMAGIVGIAAGVPLTLWVGKVGIDLSSMAPDGFALSGTVFDPVMYAKVTVDSIYLPFLMLLAVAFASALYPAVKAAVIEPVKAIYHI